MATIVAAWKGTGMVSWEMEEGAGSNWRGSRLIMGGDEGEEN